MRELVRQLLAGQNQFASGGFVLMADFEFKYLLKRTQLSRKKPPLIKTVTGGADASSKSSQKGTPSPR